MSSANNTERELDDFIVKWGPQNCYLGITDDDKIRLNQHNVRDSNGNKTDERTGWIIRKVNSENDARTIEKNLLQKYANIISGDTGGGQNPNIVYVYYIVSGVTDENA